MSLRSTVRSRISLATRVTILTTAAVGLTVAVISLAVYVTVRSQLSSSIDESLLERTHDAANAGFATGGAMASIPPSMFLASDVKIAVISNDRVISVPDGRAALPYISKRELAVADHERDDSIRTVQLEGESYRVVAVNADPGVALVVAQSIEPTERVLERLGIVMWVVGSLGMLVAGVSGWAVASSALRPVRRLTTATERVARTGELTPIEVSGDDELARLTHAFNQMMVALHASQERQRQLVGDAGHELRTPLTSLRTNIDLLTQADRSGGLSATARAELLRDVRAQIAEMTTLVGDLVELARDADTGSRVETIELSAVVRSSVERVRLRAPGIEFVVVTNPCTVHGDSHLIERAITNLLDNAAKWSPPLGEVTVRLDDGVLTVADDGPGIADEDLPHVFERFYRSREARTLPGSGLGLAIVRQTAERHGGTVSAGRAPGGGALFTLALPHSDNATE